jgi:hypothetical protein
MVILDVPRFMPDRKVHLVRVTLVYGEIICEDEWVKQEIEDLKPSCDSFGPCPDHEMALARLCEHWLRAPVAGIRHASTTGSLLRCDPG